MEIEGHGLHFLQFVTATIHFFAQVALLVVILLMKLDNSRQKEAEVLVLFCLHIVLFVVSIAASKFSSSFSYLTVAWFFTAFDISWTISQVAEPSISRVLSVVRLGFSSFFMSVLVFFNWKTRGNQPGLSWLSILESHASDVLNLSIFPWVILCFLWHIETGPQPVIVCTLSLIVPWARMGVFSDRSKLVDFFLFMVITFMIMAFWAAQFKEAIFQYLFRTWPFFTASWLISELVTSASLMICISRRYRQLQKREWNSTSTASGEKLLSPARNLSTGADPATGFQHLDPIPVSTISDAISEMYLTRTSILTEVPSLPHRISSDRQGSPHNSSAFINSIGGALVLPEQAAAESLSRVIDPVISPLPMFDCNISVVNPHEFSQPARNAPVQQRNSCSPQIPASATATGGILSLTLTENATLRRNTLDSYIPSTGPPSYRSFLAPITRTET